MAIEREDLSDVNDGRYNNILLFLAVGVLLYILVSGWRKSKQAALSDAIGSDQNALLAQQLRQAFQPWGSNWTMGIDSTDTTAVLSVATQIRNYTAVADAYRTLYNSDLSTDLASELSAAELQQFWASVGAAGTTTTTPNVGPATTTKTPTGNSVIIGPQTVVKSLLNKTCVATQSVHVRVYKEPGAIADTATKGENVGKYAGEADLTINGTKGRFVHVKKPAVWGLYDVDSWVHKGSLTFI
ncbi:hypothetical protein [Spirosoma areae]